ncbi:MAG: hypothetical protein PHQ11_15860 [Paludibacter sp.]|nr:hypothetical protein [Paludibacter sp.]
MKEVIETPEILQEIFNKALNTVGAISNPLSIINKEAKNKILFGGA